jgi:phage baseplate assembly protein W
MSVKTVRTYSDLNMLFKPHPVTKDVTRKFNNAAVEASMKGLIMTNFGERPFHPEIGSGIRGLLFELSTPGTKIAIRTCIESVINNFEPRVILEEVSVEDSGENGYRVMIDYRIINSLEPVSMTIMLRRVR